MDFDINDENSNVMDLNDKTLTEIFEIFKFEISNLNSSNIIVRFNQNGFFILQEKEKITFWDVRKFNIENVNKLSNVIVDFCIKNDIEIILI